MTKLRNIAFILIVALVSFSVIGYSGIDKVAPFIAEKPNKSAVEKRNYVKLADVLNSSFMDGKAQDKFEQYLADSTPFRDSLLFGNAGLQRSSIKIAAKVFGYAIYPTFFGSKFNEQAQLEFVSRNGDPIPDGDSKSKDAWINTVNDAARNHPEIRFSVTILADTRHNELNPTYELLSGNKVNTRWIQENIINQFDPSLNAVLDPVSKTSDLSADCFNTDLHWTMERALETYNRIGNEMGWKHYEWKDPICVVDRWFGTDGRSGLDQDYPSDLWDLPILFDNLEYHNLKKNGKFSESSRDDPGRRLRTLKSKSKKMKQDSDFDGYGTYHGPFNGKIINTASNNGKNCLVIGDSFSHCLKRYIADNYETTYIYLPGNKKMNLSLEEMIDGHDIDDVVIITQALKYRQFKLYSPKFIGLENADGDTDEDEITAEEMDG